MIRSGNPALSKKTFEDLSSSSGGVMTLEGAVNKSAISLLILLACGAYTYNMALSQASIYIWPGVIGGLIVALITIFKKTWSPITVPIYAALEGVALGGISRMDADFYYPGIVTQSILITACIFAALLLAYKSKLIKPTENFKLGIAAATGGIFLFYIISWVFSIFSGGLPPLLDPSNGGLLSIGFSLFVVVIASLNLVMDFDFIEEGAERGAPKYMEWYGAFGLLVTLIWLYLEILRLLAKLNSRR